MSQNQFFNFLCIVVVKHAATGGWPFQIWTKLTMRLWQNLPKKKEAAQNQVYVHLPKKKEAAQNQVYVHL
jgi:hypothetical protein